MEHHNFFILLMSIIGIASLISGIRTYNKAQWLLENGIRTTATIFDLVRRRSKKSNYYTYHPVVEFQAQDGREFRKELDTGTSSPSYSKGDKVDILYNPNKPPDLIIDSMTYTRNIPLVFMIIGAILLIAATLMYLEVF